MISYHPMGIGLHLKIKADIKKRMMLKNYILIAILISVALPVTYPDGLAADSSATVPRISVDDLKALLGDPDVAIIDVRTQKNWWSSTNKILSAAREDPSKVSQWQTKYSKDKILIFYCS